MIRKKNWNVYQRLVDDGGQIKVKLEKTFFNAYHAEVKDRLNGITWVLNYFINGTF